MKKPMYYVRENNESFEQMVSAHVQPYASFEDAEVDAIDAVVNGELDSDHVEVVKVMVEEITKIKVPTMTRVG
jgi:hypothetical protein